MKKSLLISMLSALAVTAPAAAAEPFPSKAITIIVGVAPGGSLDALARLGTISSTPSALPPPPK